MADEQDTTTTQTEETSSSTDQSTVTPSLDDFLGTETETSTVSQPDTEKLAKKAHDFDGLLPKYQAAERRAKELEAKLAAFETAPAQPTTFDPEAAKNDPGVNFLLDQLEARVAQRIAPLTAEKQREQDKTAFEAYWSDPYTSSLKDAAQTALRQTDPAQPMSVRTEQAMKNFLYENRGILAQAHLEVGQEQGFKAKQLKQSGGLVGKPSVPAAKDDFADRYRAGELTTEEMRENMDKIQELDRQERNS